MVGRAASVVSPFYSILLAPTPWLICPKIWSLLHNVNDLNLVWNYEFCWLTFIDNSWFPGKVVCCLYIRSDRLTVRIAFQDFKTKLGFHAMINKNFTSILNGPSFKYGSSWCRRRHLLTSGQLGTSNFGSRLNSFLQP